MVPDKFNMVDMGGIDLIMMQGEAVPGLYDKLMAAISNCRYQCLYNWLFDGVLIPPTYVQIEYDDSEVYLNEGVSVTSDDVIHIYSVEPGPVEPEIIPLLAEENGVYNVPTGKDGFNPVTVDVPSYTPVINSITITENGTYNAPAGVDGYSPVVVDVSGASGVTFSENDPTSAEGENGDYWYVRISKQIAPQFTPNTNANSAITGGLVFTAVDGTVITGLAFYARTSMISVHLSLSDGTELAGFDNVSAVSEQWNYYSLDTPITLSSGVSYVVWGANDSGAMKYANVSTDAGGITYVRAAYSTSRNVFPNTPESTTRYGVAVLTEKEYGVITKQYYKINNAWQRIDL